MATNYKKEADIHFAARVKLHAENDRLRAENKLFRDSVLGPFICGVGEYPEGDSLPKMVMVCPAMGSDYVAVYTRAHEQSARRAALDALTEHDQALGLYDNEQNGNCPECGLNGEHRLHCSKLVISVPR